MKEITCQTIKEWRNWLIKNYKKEDKVLLIRFKKHTGKRYFNQRQAMDEAICFGWIDTTLYRLDDDKYGVSFVKRKRTSKWSYNTFARAKEMIKQKKMSDFGLEKYKEGLKRKPHDYKVPKNPKMSSELKKALGSKNLFKKFRKLAPSKKKMFLLWLWSAKRKETRERRIKEIIDIVEKS
jgi:uncharacterized protein YdeI (YjbR/CyaY-like superfamily)